MHSLWINMLLIALRVRGQKYESSSTTVENTCSLIMCKVNADTCILSVTAKNTMSTMPLCCFQLVVNKVLGSCGTSPPTKSTL